MPGDAIPFSKPYRAAGELDRLAEALGNGISHGDGPFTKAAAARLLEIIPARAALLTPSGTHALEMMSLLLGLGPGDEVIMPSFTFPSAATAVTLVGATPVFVDIDPTTGNIDPAAIRVALSDRTKAISVMHYGGVGVDFDEIATIAAERSVPVLEDNAHGIGATYRGRRLGTLAALAAQSFHDTKNIHSGEGGALLVNDTSYLGRAEVIREKGTNRSQFLRGQVDKYTWVDLGSSYLMSELGAAVLDAQLAEFDAIQQRRHAVWDRYATELTDWAASTGATLMQVPADREHPAHLFYFLMPSLPERDAILGHLRGLGIGASFHYIPLDDAPAGLRYGRTPVECVQSHDFSSRLVRLPLWPDMSPATVDRVIDGVTSFRAA